MRYTFSLIYQVTAGTGTADSLGIELRDNGTSGPVLWAAGLKKAVTNNEDQTYSGNVIIPGSAKPTLCIKTYSGFKVTVMSGSHATYSFA